MLRLRPADCNAGYVKMARILRGVWRSYYATRCRELRGKWSALSEHYFFHLADQPYVFRRVTSGEEFRKYAEQNQWDSNFKGAEESRKFRQEQYGELKGVVTYLGLVKKQ